MSIKVKRHKVMVMRQFSRFVGNDYKISREDFGYF